MAFLSRAKIELVEEKTPKKGYIAEYFVDLQENLRMRHFQVDVLINKLNKMEDFSSKIDAPDKQTENLAKKDSSAPVRRRSRKSTTTNSR
jgi:hypothetical protein